LPLEVLLFGPLQLGISFEFWSQLADKYLDDSNAHTPSIMEAKAKGLFGVDEEEIHRCFRFYFDLILATWRFERTFTVEYFEAGYLAYTVRQPLSVLRDPLSRPFSSGD